MARHANRERPSRVGEALGADLVRSGIIYAGVRVFSRLGFAAARVEDLLVEAGIARRTFYRHFRNKEDVLVAIYEFATRELVAAVRAPGPSADPVGALHRAIDIYFDHCADNGPLAAILVQRAMAPGSPLAGPRQRFRDELILLAERAVHGTTGRRHDAMLYAALLSAIEGVSLEMLAAPIDARATARAKMVVHQLVDRALGLPTAKP